MSTNNENNPRCSRRDFLQKAALSGAAAYGSPVAGPRRARRGQRRIKIGLIGCGGRAAGRPPMP